MVVSNSTALSWLVRVTNWIFGGTIRRVMGLVLTTSAKQLVVPVVNMIIANQVNIKQKQQLIQQS